MFKPINPSMFGTMYAKSYDWMDRLFRGASVSWRDQEVADRFLVAGADHFDMGREAHENGYRFWSLFHRIVADVFGRIYNAKREK